jgi:hypothetical protein
MPRRLTVRQIGRLLIDSISDDDMQNNLQELNDLSWELRKEEGEFAKELSEELKERVEIVANDKDLCPDCFAETEVRFKRFKGYFTDETERRCTGECGWHE